jgi:hypothetical protein
MSRQSSPFLGNPDLPDIALENSLGSPIMGNRRKRVAPCEQRLRESLQKLQDIRLRIQQNRAKPNDYYALMGHFAREDYWFFLRAVLGYKFADPWDHGEELLWWIKQNWGHPMLVLVPRGGMKSGLITVPMLPWLLASDPTLCSFIVNVREERAADFARSAARIIQTKNYLSCFPEVRPGTKWGEGGYFLEPPRDRYEGAATRVDPNISSYGVGGNITSAHVRAIIHDDLINETTYDKPNERAKAKRTFMESLNCLDPNGMLLVCATRWHPADLYGEMEDGALLGNSGPFRVFKRECTRTVMGEGGQWVTEVFNPHRTYFDFRGTEQHVGYTPEFLQNAEQNLGRLFYALYRNNPLSESVSVFDLSKIKLFEKEPFTCAPYLRLGIEAEGQAGAFYMTFLKIMRERGKNYSVERLSAGRRGTGKSERIRSFIGPLIETERLYLREDLYRNGQGALGKELREFTVSDEDDAVDALSHCINRAPKYVEGKPPSPYIAVDPAFTDNKGSNHTAIVCGCRFEDKFYVLDCQKFKAVKPDTIITMILRMADKFSSRSGALSTRAPRLRAFVSPGNERGLNSSRRRGYVIWGDPYEEAK